MYEVKQMSSDAQQTTAMDYEKITIYPMWYDAKTRKELDRVLRSLGITFSYERY